LRFSGVVEWAGEEEKVQVVPASSKWSSINWQPLEGVACVVANPADGSGPLRNSKAVNGSIVIVESGTVPVRYRSWFPTLEIVVLELVCT
jgi:hypothetical protein